MDVQLAPPGQPGPLAQLLLVVAVVPDEARLEIHLELEDPHLEAHPALELDRTNLLHEEPVVPEERSDALLADHGAQALPGPEPERLLDDLGGEGAEPLEHHLLDDRAIRQLGHG